MEKGRICLKCEFKAKSSGIFKGPAPLKTFVLLCLWLLSEVIRIITAEIKHLRFEVKEKEEGRMCCFHFKACYWITSISNYTYLHNSVIIKSRAAKLKLLLQTRGKHDRSRCCRSKLVENSLIHSWNICCTFINLQLGSNVCLSLDWTSL